MSDTDTPRTRVGQDKWRVHLFFIFYFIEYIGDTSRLFRWCILETCVFFMSFCHIKHECNFSKSCVILFSFVCRYAKHPALLGIELLNEPSAASVPLDLLVSYYKQGYQIIRKHSSTAYVIVCQRIGNADPLELYQANIGSTNIVLDLHYYNLFDTFFVNMSTIDNIQFIYKSRETQLQTLNSANGPLVFIGKPWFPLQIPSF